MLRYRSGVSLFISVGLTLGVVLLSVLLSVAWVLPEISKQADVSQIDEMASVIMAIDDAIQSIFLESMGPMEKVNMSYVIDPRRGLSYEIVYLVRGTESSITIPVNFERGELRIERLGTLTIVANRSWGRGKFTLIELASVPLVRFVYCLGTEANVLPPGGVEILRAPGSISSEAILSKAFFIHPRELGVGHNYGEARIRFAEKVGSIESSGSDWSVVYVRRVESGEAVEVACRYGGYISMWTGSKRNIPAVPGVSCAATQPTISVLFSFAALTPHELTLSPIPAGFIQVEHSHTYIKVYRGRLEGSEGWEIGYILNQDPNTYQPLLLIERRPRGGRRGGGLAWSKGVLEVRVVIFYVDVLSP